MYKRATERNKEQVYPEGNREKSSIGRQVAIMGLTIILTPVKVYRFLQNFT